MSDDRLGNLGFLVLHGFDFELNTQIISDNFIKKHPRKMCKSLLLSEFYNLWSFHHLISTHYLI